MSVDADGRRIPSECGVQSLGSELHVRRSLRCVVACEDRAQDGWAVARSVAHVYVQILPARAHILHAFAELLTRFELLLNERNAAFQNNQLLLSGERSAVVSGFRHCHAYSARVSARRVGSPIEVFDDCRRLHSRLNEESTRTLQLVFDVSNETGFGCCGVHLEHSHVRLVEIHARALEHPVELARRIVEEHSLVVRRVDERVAGQQVRSVDAANHCHLAVALAYATQIDIVGLLVEISAEELALRTARHCEELVVAVLHIAESCHLARFGVDAHHVGLGISLVEAVDAVGCGVVCERSGCAFAVVLQRMFREQLVCLCVIDAPHGLLVLASAAELVGVYLSVVIDAAAQGVDAEQRSRLVGHETVVVSELIEARSHVCVDVYLAPCYRTYEFDAFHADALEVVVRISCCRHA